MRNFMFLAFFISVLGCEQGTNPGQSKGTPTIRGSWKLKKLIAGWTNEEISAEALDYQEYYTFEEDSTFIKYRTNGEQARGTFTTGQSKDGLFVKAIYPEETSLIDDCTAAREEYLRLENGMLVGGSLPCDGPGLYYEKVDRIPN